APAFAGVHGNTGAECDMRRMADPQGLPRFLIGTDAISSASALDPAAGALATGRDLAGRVALRPPVRPVQLPVGTEGATEGGTGGGEECERHDRLLSTSRAAGP